MQTALLCLTSAALGAALTLLVPTSAPAPEPVPETAPARTPEVILASYVEDFRGDRAAATPRTFGIRVEGEEGGAWTVAVSGAAEGGGRRTVQLRRGLPDEATFAYTVDAATLADVDAGRLNALTVQGKAYPGDPTPMEVEWLNGAEPFDINAFSFHFWTRGFPEQVPFDRSRTREVHGANNVVFYYQPGFRSAWTSLQQGQKVEAAPGVPMQIPFPMMVIGTRGRVHGLVDGQPTVSEEGQMTFIPPNTPYLFWNEEEEPGEAVLIWFGEGA